MPVEAPSPDPTNDWLTGAEAEKYSRLSLKTLQRADARGEECGLRRVARRLLFNRDLLSTWLLAQTEKSAAVAAPVRNIRLAHPAR